MSKSDMNGEFSKYYAFQLIIDSNVVVSQPHERSQPCFALMVDMDKGSSSTPNKKFQTLTSLP